MIEKLKRPVKIGGTTFREKINELVDAVNELQESQNIYWTDIGEIKAKIAKGFKNLKAPADPYAEQRK